jgi:hypothetical protein
VAGVTYAIFDPVRMFFVTSKITQRFNPQEYALYRWLRNEAWGHFSQPTTAGKTSVWADDKEKTEKLKSWLAETPGNGLKITALLKWIEY